MAGSQARTNIVRFSNNRRKRNQKNLKQNRFFDYSLLFVVLFLIVFGLVMIYSASSYKAGLDTGNPAYYFKKQLIASILGVGVMLFFSFFDYHRLEKYSVLAYGLAVVLIFLVCTPLGMEINGARRWLNLGVTSFQPAEAAKLAMIIFLATMINKMGRSVHNIKAIGVLVAFTGVIAVLILWVTRNLSSAIIILGIAAVMIFVTDYDYKKYILAALLVIAAAAAVIFFAVARSGAGDFRMKRIVAWLDPASFSNDTAFQTLQALYAIGSGGILGKGLGESMQKLGFLPEAQNDMIFSIICEELGLFGAFSVIVLFIILIWRLMVIANNAPDLFGALLTVGVMGHLAIQVVLNIAVVTNSIPNTGISLPFISYGGTSVLFLLIEIGIVLNVSRNIRFYDV